MFSMRLTFKSYPKASLGPVGKGTPRMDICINGLVIGDIRFNDNWNGDPKMGIRVFFLYHPTEEFKAEYPKRRTMRVMVRRKFKSGEEAKEWVDENLHKHVPKIWMFCGDWTKLAKTMRRVA